MNAGCAGCGAGITGSVLSPSWTCERCGRRNVNERVVAQRLESPGAARAETLVQIARLDFAAGRFGESADRFAQAAVEDPGSALIWSCLGIATIHAADASTFAGAVTKSAACLDRAREIDPDDPSLRDATVHMPSIVAARARDLLAEAMRAAAGILKTSEPEAAQPNADAAARSLQPGVDAAAIALGVPQTPPSHLLPLATLLADASRIFSMVPVRWDRAAQSFHAATASLSRDPSTRVAASRLRLTPFRGDAPMGFLRAAGIVAILAFLVIVLLSELVQRLVGG